MVTPETDVDSGSEFSGLWGFLSSLWSPSFDPRVGQIRELSCMPREQNLWEKPIFMAKKQEESYEIPIFTFFFFLLLLYP